MNSSRNRGARRRRPVAGRTHKEGRRIAILRNWQFFHAVGGLDENPCKAAAGNRY
jgi:hypothetical protein